MTKLTKDDLALWNSYKSNLKRVAKRVNNVEKIKIPLNKENKTTKIIDQNFNLDKKLLNSLKNNKVVIDSILDLHGFSKNEAQKMVEKFILDSFFNEKRNLVIITGKGVNNEGVLKKFTPIWLSQSEYSNFIVGYTIMPRSSGGEGAIYIKIRNKSKLNAIIKQ